MSSREIDGQVLTLSASGWTYFTRFVLYDYETESMWFLLDGDTHLTSKTGRYADRELEPIVGTVTSWTEWATLHPETKYVRY